MISVNFSINAVTRQSYRTISDRKLRSTVILKASKYLDILLQRYFHLYVIIVIPLESRMKEVFL